MIVAMLAFGGGAPSYRLAEIVAVAATIGAFLQLAVQLPTVLSLLGRLRLSLDLASAHVRQVFRSFGPVVLSRGVVQISAYVDQVLASLLPTGAVAGLAYAQLIYTLPVSLFGMSISASELPEMARATGSADEVAGQLRARLTAGLRRIAFLVVPSAVALLALGDVIAALLYQSGQFTHADAVYVWGILAGSSVGLLASTMGRLYASTFYALRDTRTPLNFALVRVVLTTALGWFAAIVLPPLVGIEPRWGVTGLTASAGIAGWVEFALLRTVLRRRIGPTTLEGAFIARLWAAALAGAAVAWSVKLALGPVHPLLAGPLVLLPYGATFVGVAIVLGVPEARAALGAVQSLIVTRK
jgi:putative peptidoglycan lipid II flippase